jgi:hypothetical protein
MNIREVNGRHVDDGETVTVDHSVQVFTVVVRSMSRVGPDTIKNLIEKRHEVVKVEEIDSTLYVHAPVVRDFP